MSVHPSTEVFPAKIGSKTTTSRTVRLLTANRLTLVGAVLAGIFVLTAVIGPYLAPDPPTLVDLPHRFLAPGVAGHLLGTDELGRDIWSRLLVGSRSALEVAALVLAIAVSVGTLVGTAAALGSRAMDDFLMRLTDMFLAFPPLILAMALATALGPDLFHAMLAMAVVWWPVYARLIRGQLLSLRETAYVEAARAQGATAWRLVWRHLLPNALDSIVVQISMDVGNTILTAASLAFVGLGAQPPAPDWGLMVSSGRLYMLNEWWIATFPGLAILVTVLAFNLLGDGIRDALDPALRYQ